jgi:thymidylate synthase
LFTENGAYGPRIAEQLDRIVPMMTVDPSGRQHTAYVARDGDQYTSDMPCTNSMHWFIRGGRLYMHVFMRSSDVVKGLPYDMMMFGGLNMAIARCVGVVPGPVLLNAASSHIYEEDISKGKTAEVLTRRFQFNDQVPKTWSEVKDWALQENTAMPAETYPMGITMLRKEGRIHV